MPVRSPESARRPAPRALSRRRRLRGAAGCGAIALALPALALLLAVGRIALYRQVDDAGRIDAKRAYLESVASASPRRFNLVVVLFDDLGPGDLGAYGTAALATPRIDRLASEGALFTAAYAASPYCSASRAGLLTGRYAVRSELDLVVQAPGSPTDWLLKLGGRNRRLPAEEITLAEILSAAGWRTALVGKWHLGSEAPSRPRELGFDHFFGLYHSNDQGRPRLWDGGRVVEEAPIDQSTLTRRYTRRAVEWIEAAGDAPFFLYLAHTFPHVPLHAAEDRRGRSAGGLYGDVIEELDWSVGRVLDAVERAGAANDTLMIVTSDNGPWFQGSPGGLRGRKLDVFEGGMRVPLVVRWPGRVAPGRVVDDPVVGVDLVPTVLAAADLPPPPDRRLDGRSLVPLLNGERVRPAPVYFHRLGRLEAVRLGRFKYHRRHGVFFGNPMDWPWGPMRRRGPWLFDLELDPDESYDVSERHPEVARRLARRLDRRDAELAANRRGWRPPP